MILEIRQRAVVQRALLGRAQHHARSRASLQRFLTGVPYRFKVADGPVQFNSVLVRIDALSGKADGIERLDREVEVA